MADSTDRADLDLWRKLAAKERKGADPDGLVWQTPASKGTWGGRKGALAPLRKL